MLRLENVATPPEAALLRVPESDPLPGFVPIAMFTELVAEAIVFPKASSIATFTAGAIETPAPASLGCVVKTSWAAGADVMLNALLVPETDPGPAEDAASV